MNRDRSPGLQVVLLLPLFLAVAGSGLLAHATLLTPRPRTKLTLKVGPCGGVARTDEPLEVEAGSLLDVTWEEYIDHPGFYRILFSHAGDADFEPLLDNLPDREATAEEPILRYSAQVKLPSVPCEEGTLLLIQVMTEDPEHPRLYFSCADLRLVEPVETAGIRRGDSNADGRVDLSDALATLGHLFQDGPAARCEDAADANDDGRVDISDAIFELLWLFAAGDPLPPPGASECGSDPTEDGLPACSAGESCR